MNDLIITVTGWVATDPKLHVGPSGISLASFRLASSSRYYDRAKESWADGATEWFTVRGFRASAVFIAESIAKGQPVLVHGRLRTNTWQAEDGPRTDMVLDVISVGHDLTKGIARFTRAVQDSAVAADDTPPDDTEDDPQIFVDGAEGAEAADDELDGEDEELPVAS